MAGSTELESARKRVFAFFAIFLLVAMVGDAVSEMDKPVHAIDDWVVGLALVGVVLLLLWWKGVVPVDLQAQNNAFVVLFLLMVVAKIYGVMAEAGTDDFGDEIPVLIGLVLAIINRYA